MKRFLITVFAVALVACSVISYSAISEVDSYVPNAIEYVLAVGTTCEYLKLGGIENNDIQHYVDKSTGNVTLLFHVDLRQGNMGETASAPFLIECEPNTLEIIKMSAILNPEKKDSSGTLLVLCVAGLYPTRSYGDIVSTVETAINQNNSPFLFINGNLELDFICSDAAYVANISKVDQ